MRDGQVRVFWEDTPVDIFLNHLPFHDVVARGVVRVPLESREIPVLDGSSLIVFKAMFDRTRDRADIEAVIEWNRKPAEDALIALGGLIGEDEPTYRRLQGLLGQEL